MLEAERKLSATILGLKLRCMLLCALLQGLLDTPRLPSMAGNILGESTLFNDGVSAWDLGQN